jgi:hypothetical protein
MQDRTRSRGTFEMCQLLTSDNHRVAGTERLEDGMQGDHLESPVRDPGSLDALPHLSWYR